MTDGSGTSKKRVLFYTPYGNWYLHTLYELTVAHSLLLRGAVVKFAGCNGLFSDCDMAWINLGPRPRDICRNCMGQQEVTFERMKMPLDWLGDYLPKDAFSVAKAWVSSIGDEDLFQVSYENYPLGQWAKSSVHSHFRMGTLDLSDPLVRQAYKSYLFGTLVSLLGLRNLYDSYCPDVLMMLNGRFFSHRVAFELARARGIKIIVHERGRQDNSLALWENECCLHYDSFLRSWKEWEHAPLSQAELAAIWQVVEERVSGKNTSWKSFVPPTTVPSREKLGISGTEKIVSLFTSSDDEVVAYEGWKAVIDQFQWIRQTIEQMRDRQGFTLVIRLHPNTANISGTNHQQMEQSRQLAENLPANIRIIWPQDPISSYELLADSHCCLVLSSTIGFEAAVRGVPTLCAGLSPYYGHGFTFDLERPENYHDLLEQLLNATPSKERTRAALRFGYHYFIRTNFPFPLVKVINVHDAQITYESTASLLPDKDKSLDRICDKILYDQPLVPPPEATALTSTADEDAFLAKIVA